MDFARFDAATAPEQDFQAFYDLQERARITDRPGAAPRSREAAEAFLRTCDTGSWPVTAWTARDAGQIVALGHFQLFLEENTDLAAIHITVDPVRRRRGIGTEFLRVLVPEARRHHRTRVIGPNILKDSGSELWALRMGFAVKSGHVAQRLDIAEHGRDAWDAVPAPDGYRVEEWTGRAPQHILASLARARDAMHDMPRGDLGFESPTWSPERIRKEEDAWISRGAEQRAVVAVHEASGEVAAVTELIIRAGVADQADQHDTAVLAAHRGRGLGRAVKAAMMRTLVRERPAIVTVNTQTAVENVFMQRVNHQLGYVTLRTELDTEATVAEIERRLSEN